MSKNGLFLLSLGLLLFMFSVNQQTLAYDVLSMTTAVFFIGTRSWLMYKANKKKKQENLGKEKGEV